MKILSNKQIYEIVLPETLQNQCLHFTFLHSSLSSVKTFPPNLFPVHIKHILHHIFSFSLFASQTYDLQQPDSKNYRHRFPGGFP